MADAQGSLIWYELITSDPAGAKTFYDAVVGWDIEPEPAGPIDYRMIRRGDGGNAGGLLPLSDDMARNGGRPVWLGYVHVDDVDEVARATREEGGQVHMPPTDMPGIGRMAMISDPWGAPFYVMRPTPPADQPDAVSDVFSVDRPRHIRWNELTTSDPDGATGYYTRHFGWTQENSMPMGELGSYRFLERDGVVIGAIAGLMPGNTQSRWTYYIGVDEIDRATKAVTDGGGQVLMGPHQIPGGEYSLIGLDPQGATFGLVGPRHS